MAKKNYNLIMGLSALVAIVLIISFVGYWVSKPKPHVIQGEVEASDYRISCMVPGHVTELYCREGQQVRKGDTVAFIDSPQVRAKLAQAQAALGDGQQPSLVAPGAVGAEDGSRGGVVAGVQPQTAHDSPPTSLRTKEPRMPLTKETTLGSS
jgi:multidrug efflux pump subunit AcrA (membrane-fusion protein)